MELGKAKLRLNGMNNLKDALHPDHGLIWTDGKGIFLAPVHLYRDQVQNAGCTRLGEFEHVQSVHWSCASDHGGCYMAAVHQHNVSVWHVSGTVPRLAFKQVRKINVQPVAQGCLWNPKCDVLCLLGQQQCSFYFRHSQNRGSFAFPSLEHENISCGCWSPDGKRLVLCVGTALLIYTWSDLAANISEFVTTAWRIPGVSGTITAIVPGSNSSVVCASDLPLQSLCKNNNSDMFHLPEAGKSHHSSDGVIRPTGASSVKDSLLTLHPNIQNPSRDSAMLSMIQLHSGLQDPTLLTSTVIPGLLSPDILHFQMESQCVVLGSSTQSVLQVFALLDSHLTLADHLTLEKDERPKGMGGLPTSQPADHQGVLVLVGRAEPTDPTFPSPKNTAVFDLSLKFFPVRLDKAKQIPNGHAAPVKSTSSAALVTSEKVHEASMRSASDSRLLSQQGRSTKERPQRGLQSSNTDSADDKSITLSLSSSSTRNTGPRLVEEVGSIGGVVEAESTGKEIHTGTSQPLETERVDFSQSKPQFHNSTLSQRYEMSPRTDRYERNWTESWETGVNQGQDAAKEELTNGHAGSEKREQTFQEEAAHRPLSSSKDNSSVPQGKTSTSQLTAWTAVKGSNPSWMDRGGKPMVDDGGSVCSSLNSSDSNYEVLEKQIQSQRDHIDALKKKLNDLAVMVEDSACVFPVRYQKMTEPEAVSVQCTVGGASASRKFLLDNGRLQLDPVKQAFGLLTVELILEGEPMILGANIDGYIPMRFSPDSVLHITGIPLTPSPQLAPKFHKKETS